MIDKLELLIPESKAKISDQWNTSRRRVASPGSPYQFTIDLRRELALSVHSGSRVPVPRAKSYCKIDFVDTRLMCADDILRRVNWLFGLTDQQAHQLKVARIDLTADIMGTPVSWFHQHCRVLKKRRSEQYETVKKDTERGVTTLNFGKRPNMYRIYDRIAEKQFRKEDVLYHEMHLGSPEPTVTRIERQCTGKGVPRELATLGAVFENAEDFNPYETLVLSDGIAEPRTDAWKPQRWLMNLGLAYAVQQLGIAAVRSRLNKSRNATRYFEKYSELLNSSACGPTVEDLSRSYKASTTLQLNIPRRGSDGDLLYPAGMLSWVV